MNDGRPLGRVPLLLLFLGLGGARRSTEKHHYRVALGRDVAKEENIATATAETLEHRIAQLTVLVEADFFTLGANQMIDNMTATGTATPVAEPFLRQLTPDHVHRVVNATIATRMCW